MCADMWKNTNNTNYFCFCSVCNSVAVANSVSVSISAYEAVAVTNI